MPGHEPLPLNARPMAEARDWPEDRCYVPKPLSRPRSGKHDQAENEWQQPL